MSEERSGVITFKGGPLTLIGPKIKAGDRAPDFKVIDGSLKEVTLKCSAGKTRLISVVPSLDTPVCEVQTKRFNDEAAKLPAGVEVLTISVDLPFAQGRFCTANGTNKIKTLSDHRETSFGKNYGVLIKELKLLTRAIFVVDANDKVTHVEIVPEVTQHPDYAAALNAARAAVS